MRSPRPLLSALPLLELAALVVAALTALGFQLTLPGRLPTDADYRAAADALRAQAREGDALLLFPWWTERARLFVPASVPVYGYLGSDAAPLTAHPRIWVLAQPRLPRADAGGFEAAFGPGRTREGAPQRFGHLELTLYTNGRHRPHLFRATDVYGAARVYLESARGPRRTCPFDGRAHRCPGPAHLYVAPEWHELRYEPRRCLWMHPPGGATRLVAEFDGVPGGTGLRLEGGIIWEHAAQRGPRLSATHVGVEDGGGGRLLQLALPPGLEGVQAAEVALPAGGPHTLRVWVQADNPESRQVCLDLFALGPPVQEGA